MSASPARLRPARSAITRPGPARAAAAASAQTAHPVFRKLWPTDQGRLEDHLLRLDGVDRQMRFCGRVSDGAIRAYCERIDWSKTTILGCFVDREMRGVAELVHTQRAIPGNAELALTVEKPFQDQGFGTELLRKTLVLARNRYVSTVYMVCLLENRKIQHIARKFEASLVFHGGEVEGKIWPPWPTWLSFIEEAASDGHALFRATFETATSSVADSGNTALTKRR